MKIKFEIDEIAGKEIHLVPRSFISNFGTIYAVHGLIKDTILKNNFYNILKFAPYKKYEGIFSRVKLYSKNAVWTEYVNPDAIKNIPEKYMVNGSHGKLLNYYIEAEIVKINSNKDEYTNSNTLFYIQCDSKDYASLKMLVP